MLNVQYGVQQSRLARDLKTISVAGIGRRSWLKDTDGGHVPPSEFAHLGKLRRCGASAGEVTSQFQGSGRLSGEAGAREAILARAG